MSADTRPGTGDPVTTAAARRPAASPSMFCRPAGSPNGPIRVVLGLLPILCFLALIPSLPHSREVYGSGVVGSALALTCPIVLAGLGALWAERSGVVNIGLEGMMVLGTWGAAYAGIHAGWLAGLVAGVACGAVGGAIHAIATVTFEVDHVVAGVAINLLAPGLVKFLSSFTFAHMVGGGTTQSPPVPRLPTFSVPSFGLEKLGDQGLPVISPVVDVVTGVLTDLSVGAVLTALAVAATWWVLRCSRFGLRVRFSGENPAAAAARGIRVRALRYATVCLSGALAGLGGALLVVMNSGLYRDGQTGGRGYVGLAAMVFGNWTPLGTTLGAAVFGSVDAVQLHGGGSAVHAALVLAAVAAAVYGTVRLIRGQTRPAAVVLFGSLGLAVLAVAFPSIPAQAAYVAPYVAALAVLVFAGPRVRPPAAVGRRSISDEGK